MRESIVSRNVGRKVHEQLEGIGWHRYQSGKVPIVARGRLCSRGEELSGGVVGRVAFHHSLGGHYQRTKRLRPGWGEDQLVRMVSRLYEEARQAYRLLVNAEELEERFEEWETDQDFLDAVEKEGRETVYAEMSQEDIDFWYVWAEKWSLNHA